MNGTLPIKPVLEILQAQNEYVRLRIIEELMESLTPKAHEEAIFLEMEWLSPHGLDRCQEHLNDLKTDIKKDTEKVPEETIQEDYIKVGDKVRVTQGGGFGYSFIVTEKPTSSLASDDEGNWWYVGFLEVCDE